MAVLLDDLRSFLMSKGYGNVFMEHYPSVPDEIISLYERENPLAFGAKGINYGIRAAPIQIRVRRTEPEMAKADAWAIFHLLDSGSDEVSLELVSGCSVTSRPVPPTRLEVDAEGRWVWMLKTTILTSGE